MQRRKIIKQNRTSKTIGHAIGIPAEQESRIKEIFKVIATENFKKINDKYQTTDPGRPNKTKQNK